MREEWILAIILAAAVPLMAQLKPAEPAAAGMSAAGLDTAAELINHQISSRQLGAAALLVARHGKIVLDRGFGSISSQAGAPSTRPDSVFLVASITKPVTACALMLLVERGLVALGDPVKQYLPEFKGEDRTKVRVLDLLKHTSGLPDMLPENTALRRAHAPLSEFVKDTFTTPLLYPPGTSFRYQSMGILLAGEIVERVTGMRLRDFEKKQIFDRVGMSNTSLGLGGRRIADLVSCATSRGANSADEESFGANSPYWRDMGHPWGGMHTTTMDLAMLLQTFLDQGVYAGRRIFSPATVRAMTSDQNTGLNAPWGLGWALGHSTAWNEFGDLVSADTFGHAGASGTVAWADPRTQVICVVLTNRPLSADNGRLLRLVSNAVAASVER
jgi:CubicO group peptidase (beta-lactamase class C family)